MDIIKNKPTSPARHKSLPQSLVGQVFSDFVEREYIAHTPAYANALKKIIEIKKRSFGPESNYNPTGISGLLHMLIVQDTLLAAILDTPQGVAGFSAGHQGSYLARWRATTGEKATNGLPMAVEKSWEFLNSLSDKPPDMTAEQAVRTKCVSLNFADKERSMNETDEAIYYLGQIATPRALAVSRMNAINYHELTVMSFNFLWSIDINLLSRDKYHSM